MCYYFIEEYPWEEDDADDDWCFTATFANGQNRSLTNQSLILSISQSDIIISDAWSADLLIRNFIHWSVPRAVRISLSADGSAGQSVGRQEYLSPDILHIDTGPRLVIFVWWFSVSLLMRILSNLLINYTPLIILSQVSYVDSDTRTRMKGNRWDEGNRIEGRCRKTERQTDRHTDWLTDW